MRGLIPFLIPAVAIVMQAASVPQKLKIEYDELAAKAGAITETVNAMEDRAKAAGHSLNSNLIAQRTLVRSSMDDATDALKKDDAPRLKECLDRARAIIERLSKSI